jgi:hypothetical protein
MGLLRELWKTIKEYFKIKRDVRRMVEKYGTELEDMDQKLAALGYQEYSKPCWKRLVKVKERFIASPISFL